MLSAGSQLFLPQGSGGAHPVPCQNPALSFASELRCQVFEASSFPKPISHPAGALLWRYESEADTCEGERLSLQTLLSQVTDCRIRYNNHSGAGTMFGQVWVACFPEVKCDCVTDGQKDLHNFWHQGQIVLGSILLIWQHSQFWVRSLRLGSM